MAGERDVVAQLQKALAAAAQCSMAETATNYEILSERLQELRTAARREWHSRADGRSLVHKLRAGSQLTTDEVANLRLLIVGDADYYLKYDKEFERCWSDLNKILKEIEDFQSSGSDVDNLMHLGVLCEQACNMLAMTGHYLEQRDRVRRFEAATQGSIDRDTGRELAAALDEITSQ